MKNVTETLTSCLIILGTAAAGSAQAADWTSYTYSLVSTTAAVQGMERITDVRYWHHSTRRAAHRRLPHGLRLGPVISQTREGSPP